MQVVALQWNSDWQDSQKNLSRLKIQLQTLSDALLPRQVKPRLVVLPELFHGGFSMAPERFAVPLHGEFMQTLADMATEYQIHLLLGAAIRHDAVNHHYHNSALLFTPDAGLASQYIKQKPFTYAEEETVYQPGKGALLFNIGSFRCSCFICYDLRFPELFREVAKQVDVIFVLANWPESRQSHWEVLLKARAIENQCYIVGVNRLGHDGNDLHYVGGSMVISPLGEVLCYGDQHTEWIDAALEGEKVMQVRRQFPFLADM